MTLRSRISPDGLCNRPFYIPPLVEPCSQVIWINAMFSSQHGQRQASTSVCYVPCFPLVIHLLKRRCPTAILWAVVAVIVDAVQRVRRAGSLPHVVQECVKRLLPSLADGNAAATVPKVHRSVFVIAPLHHSVVSAVLWRVSAVLRMAVRSIRCAQKRLHASAAFCQPATQLYRLYEFLLPAHAPARPAVVASKPQYPPIADYLPSQVEFDNRHPLILGGFTPFSKGVV